MTDKTLLNEITMPLRWMDMDAYAHVGNARYYDFMTDARVDLFEKEKTLNDLTIQYVVVESGCTFKQPIVYPGNILLKHILR
jgi:acyl-CoA thioester hydrolase